jgi:hypothetical protein
MDDIDSGTVALPRSVRWFAPWNWKPWKRWALVVAAMAVAYPISIGPAAAAASVGLISCGDVAAAYRPVLYIGKRLPGPMHGLVWRYLSASAGDQTSWSLRFRQRIWERENNLAEEDQPADATQSENLE